MTTTEQSTEGFAAHAIAVLRKRKGVSARRLSLDAGLSESYVGKVESGECEPSLRAFAQIAFALGMTPHEIAVVVMREAITRRAAGHSSTVTPLLHTEDR